MTTELEPAASPIEQDKVPEPKPRPKKGKWWLLLPVLLLVLAGTCGGWYYYTEQQALAAAKAAYTTAAQTKEAAAQTLEAALAPAADAAANTPPDALANPALLDDLKAQIEKAHALQSADATPAVQGGKAAYAAAAQTLEHTAGAMQETAQTLTATTAAVTAARRQKAVSDLEGWIAEAERLLQQTADRVADVTTQEDLKTTIAKAKALLGDESAEADALAAMGKALGDAKAEVRASYDQWQAQEAEKAPTPSATPATSGATATAGASAGVDYAHPLVAAARQYIGTRQGFCWELVQHALGDLGYSGSGQQVMSPMTGNWYDYISYRSRATQVSISDLRPGDIIEYGPDYGELGGVDHVAIYVGGGRAIHGNYDYNGLVKEASVNIGKTLTRAYRLS